MQKLLTILFVAWGVAVSATTYYCDGTNCVLPSQAEQNGTFNNAKSTGSQYNSSGQSAPSFNYNSTDAGQSSLSGQIGSNTMDISKQGTQGSEDSYNNAKADPNYLYNQGTAQIATCKSKSDPACQAVTKYNDDETQRDLGAYDMGTNAFAYSQSVRADPSNTSCSIIRSYKPINPVENMCLVGNHQQVSCEATITPYQRQEKLNPPIPLDGTILQPNSSPNVCGVGTVTNAWIPQSDRAWFIINSNAVMFDNFNLPILMGATSGVTPCRGVSGTISTTPTNTRNLLGQFYMDWFGSQRGNVAFYQEAGQNCGVDSSTKTCVIKITLAWAGGSTFTSWSVVFARPQTSKLVTHYQYNDGCQNYR